MSISVSQSTQESAPRNMYISSAGSPYLASSPRDPSDSLVPHTIDLESPEISIHVTDVGRVPVLHFSLDQQHRGQEVELDKQEVTALRDEKATLLKKAIEEQTGPFFQKQEDELREIEITALEPVLVEINQTIASDALSAQRERDAAQEKEKQSILDEEADASRRQSALDEQEREEKQEADIGMPLPDRLQELKDKINEKRN